MGWFWHGAGFIDNGTIPKIFLLFGIALCMDDEDSMMRDESGMDDVCTKYERIE